MKNNIKHNFKMLKNIIRKIVREKIHDTSPVSDIEIKRIKSLERFKSTETIFFEKKIKIVDSVTFLNSYNEIFLEEIYKFHEENSDIIIIDCGANIGLATIYLKMNFPHAKITSFEPDPNIFNALQYNISSFGFKGVILRNEAISNQESLMRFHIEGGHSGTLTNDINDTNSVEVKAISLRKFLEEYEQITFLKIDIEGHEKNIISDI